MTDNRNYNLAYDSNERELVEKALNSLHDRLESGRTVAGTVELIDATLILDPFKPYIDLGSVKKAPRKYIQKELDWYLSKDRSIRGHVDDVEIWKQVASPEGKVNSNYGWCIFSEENGSQYERAMEQLKKSPTGRQSVCIYTRPSIQTEWNDGVNANRDFICTFDTQHFIRDDELIYIVSMRSNDAVFGFMSDFPWHCYVYQKMFQELKSVFPSLIERGRIHWHAGSFHVYERHFQLLRDVVKEYYGKN